MTSTANTQLSREEHEEREHFKKVVSAFQSYKRDSIDRLRRTERHLKKLPLDQQKLLAKQGYQESLKALESCVELNYAVIQEIIADVSKLFENAEMDAGGAGEASSPGGGTGERRTVVIKRTTVSTVL